MPTEKGWAIAGKSGLYIGWWLCRADAIGAHLEAVEGKPCHAYGRPLDEEQKRLWRGCQARGDRAVKITMTYRR